MIGPSSSHTAGACKLGYMARKINNNSIKSVICYLSGSFFKTHKGHGTDKALIGGLLGLKPDDIRLKNAFKIAYSSGIRYSFEEIDLDSYHPNTVKFQISNYDGSETIVIGSSTGGGKVAICKINDFDVSLSGDYPTLIINHLDFPGISNKITQILSDYKINIATMSVTRVSLRKAASTIIESDQEIPLTVKNYLETVEHINDVKIIN